MIATLEGICKRYTELKWSRLERYCVSNNCYLYVSDCVSHHNNIISYFETSWEKKRKRSNCVRIPYWLLEENDCGEMLEKLCKQERMEGITIKLRRTLDFLRSYDISRFSKLDGSDITQMVANPFINPERRWPNIADNRFRTISLSSEKQF